MSQTWDLVCHETKKSIWIGQGTGSMGTLYFGNAETMFQLRRFLNDHRDMPLFFICSDTDWKCLDYERYDHAEPSANQA